jgi:hypothetical protein
MRIVITIPTPWESARRWRWLLLAALIGAFALGGGQSANVALAAGSSSTETIEGPTSVGPYNSVAIGTDGLPVMSYFGVNGVIRVAHCGNSGCSSGNTITTIASSFFNLYTSMAIGSDGLPIVSYYQGQPPTGLRVVHCGNASCSSGNITTTIDSLGRNNSLAIGSDGLPVMSYRDPTNQTLRVAHCGNVLCSSGNTLNTVDGSGNPGRQNDIAIGADGLPVISYVGTSGTAIRVAHCGNVLCSAGNVLTTIDAVGTNSEDTSIAIGADGLPVFSYHDTLTGLRVAHCGTADCSSGTALTTVEGVGAGTFNAIAIGSDGVPVITYVGAAGLTFAHCGTVACASGNTLSPLGPSGSGYSSIAVSVDGLPLVARTDDSGLVLTRCGNLSCSPELAVTTVGQYALAKACYEVRDTSQSPLFEVCDNNFAGAPDAHAACVPDGVCSDDNPLEGALLVPVVNGGYFVVQSGTPPNHSGDPANLACAAATAGKCSLEFTNTPNTRPWHPWDINNDGVVRIPDISAVISHYGQDKPLGSPTPTRTPTPTPTPTGLP